MGTKSGIYNEKIHLKLIQYKIINRVEFVSKYI